MSSSDESRIAGADSFEISAGVPALPPRLPPPPSSEADQSDAVPGLPPRPPSPSPSDTDQSDVVPPLVGESRFSAGLPSSASAPTLQAVSSPPPPLPAADMFVGRKLGRYQILSVLGRGGMGVVYEAEDTRIGRRVAVKLMPKAVAQDPAAMKRFFQEARAAGRLNHPNAVRVFEADQHEGAPYLVMELVHGGSVWEQVKRYGPLLWPEATRIVTEVCRALAEAHRAGLIHRDIKPANILMDRDGRPKLADFGLAKLPLGDSVNNNLTSTSKVIGTPAYMSPEQCQGLPLDGRSDLYSLGMSYYALLAGRPPYEGNVPQMMLLHCTKETPDPRLQQKDVPRPCLDVLSRATAKSPDERYPDAGKMVQALEHAAEQGGKSSAVLKLEAVSQALIAGRKPAAKAKPARRAPIRLPKWMVPVAAGLGVGITALVMWLLLRPK